MIQLIRRTTALHRGALLLALLGVLYRGMIPAGFMPAAPGQAQRGAWLVLCSGGTLKNSIATERPSAPGAHAYAECVFALAAAPALPAAVFLLAATAPPSAAHAPALAVELFDAACGHPPARAPPLYS